jgi:hypothetical protein
VSKESNTLEAANGPADMSPKNRLALLSGGLALLIVLGLAMYIPAGPRKNYVTSSTEVSTLQNELNMAMLMKKEQEMRLQSQEKLMETLKSRPANFDLFSYMSTVLNDSGLTEDGRALLENLRNRRDLENQPAVDLTLSRVSLEELIDLLHKVYTSNNLIAVYKVDRIQPERTGNGLDCKLTLVSLSPPSASSS